MKRSSHINLIRMRKAFGVFPLKPLALCITTLLSACGEEPEQPADIFKTLADCRSTYPDLTAQCDIAFDQALKAAETTAPKYATLQDCIADFGTDQCRKQDKSDGTSWFMPAMAGFMLGQALDGGGYRSAPLFTSTYAGSPYYHRWSTADGYGFGDYRQRKVHIPRNTFKPKPAVTKTIQRGGSAANQLPPAAGVVVNLLVVGAVNAAYFLP